MNDENKSSGDISGRELDALVAVHVMGIPKYKVVAELQGFRLPLGYDVNTRAQYADTCFPSYSTDMTAAMDVLNKADGMWELTRCVEHEVLDDESTPFVLRYRCSLRFENNLGHASGCATASEAICRAALNAVSKSST